MKSPIKVQIFGQTYVIQGDLEESYVRELAAAVDAKMHGLDFLRGRRRLWTRKRLPSWQPSPSPTNSMASARAPGAGRRPQGTREPSACLNLVERALKQTA